MEHSHHHGSHHHDDSGHVHAGKSRHEQIPAHAHHDKHAGHHTVDFLKRFWVCLALTLPVLLLSPMIRHWMGIEFSFPGDKYVLLALSTVIYVYGGWPFLSGMISEMRHNALGMMTLVALAITVAYIYSVAVVIGLGGMDFFWELATLIDIMLLGHWLEMRSQGAASRALESLVALLPSKVHLETGGSVVDVDLSELNKDDTVIVKPGEKIPADGTVIHGESHVNESMLTGESHPVAKNTGMQVIGGAVNGSGVLKVKVTATGSGSYLNRIITMVQSAQAAKSNTQNLADKVAKWLTIVSISTGVITFIYWFAVEPDISFALERMVTVMVTACPHALGVAIPLVVAISTTQAAINGLLIRNRSAFENARNISLLIFDKTGTLTKGSHEVQRIISLVHDYSNDDILRYAASIQQHSEHHIAHGILRLLQKKKLELWPSSDFHYMQGMGVSGMVNGSKVVAAGPNYFREKNIDLPEIPRVIDQETESVTFILIDDVLSGVITFSDSIREGAADAIESLKKMNIKTFLLTGDNDRIASSVARNLKMDGYLSNVLPHEKQLKVKEFQNNGEVVAMTGDGVNDAPALAQADVGIAVGSGTDVAAETADIVLVNSDPEDVVKVISFGRATYRKMIENLIWAAGYNVVAIPLAAGILYNKGFVLSPAMGAVLMSLSTIIVAFNAQLLRFKLKAG